MPKAEKVTETLTVYQQPGVFSYGTDAVLLVKYVESTVVGLNGKNMCDLCSGTGIIPLMLCDEFKGLRASMLEINGDAAKLSALSAEQSNLSDRVDVYNGDVKNVRSIFGGESFDFVTCNPPYMRTDSGKMCEDDYKTIARHEVLCSISDVFAAAFYLLRTGGCAYIVYRTDRLSALMAAARENKFEVKHICFFRSRENSTQSELCVVKAMKNAAEGMKTDVYTVGEFLGRK